MSARQVRHLQQRRTALVKNRRLLDTEVRERQRNMGAASEAITHIDAQIALARGVKLTVSDHALLRLVERAGLADVEALRAGVLSDELFAAFAALGNDGKYPIGAGRTAIVKNNVVITIL